MTSNIKSSPLIILGLDAGDPDWIENWAKAGYLPNIRSIMEKGCWGRTTGVDLINEDGTWTRLFSGVPQKEQGFYYFRQLKAGSYDLYTVEETNATQQVFWSLYQGTEKKVALIDVPEMSVMPDLQGVQLSNWAVHNSHYLPPVSHPSHLLAEVKQTLGKPDYITEDFSNNFATDKRIYERLKKRVARKGKLCRQLCSQAEFDLIVAVFGECHTGGHQLWKYRPEAQGDEKVALPNELSEGIREIYQECDREIGLLLNELPADANVVLVSSVGLTDRYPTEGLIEDFCRQLGYQASPPAQDTPKSPLALLRQIIPEKWRIALSSHLSRDVKEKLLADKFRNSTDWSKTKAFAIPSAYMSFIRVNLQGREPQGIVSPGAEYEELLSQIEADLAQLVDVRSGEKAVKQIWRSDDLFGRNSHPELPDLLIEWQPFPYFLERVQHPTVELTQNKPEFFRGSDHTHQGFVAFAGNDIPLKGDIGEISLLSLAPTFVALMGDKIPHWMQAATLFKNTSIQS
ncbi:MAG: alkaline phosphatase family protein [Oscillatoria sp. PMC 1051.18]|nr:alkaline phosphatase family protein [Oscillatoria sp. PMC 1050.18]MEC5030708.1 alkaline phosphatase family protein [Oscillatoria sp. PMC 1051.18]